MKKKMSLLFVLLVIMTSCKKAEGEPNARFSFTRESDKSPCMVIFTNESTNAESYSWNFGDGYESNKAQPVHTYYRSGKFTVTLTARSKTGLATYSEVVTVATGGIEITAVPPVLGLDPFYKKYTNANGIPVISSGRVSEEALLKTRSIVVTMLAKRDDVRLMMIEKNARVGVIGSTEVTTDMPEYAFLKDDPVTNWDERARGLGGTIWVPLTTGAEENILCHSNDRYRGEDILVHEFAHAIHGMGIKYVEDDFEQRLNALFTNAVNSGLWADTYAETNFSEYWAEGVQDWFNVNAFSSPSNGIHNHIDTRDKLQQYDPDLYNLISEYFDETLTGSCHEK